MINAPRKIKCILEGRYPILKCAIFSMQLSGITTMYESIILLFKTRLVGGLMSVKRYKCQTYRNSHLFGKSVSPCIFLILIYTDQEHTGTHTFSKCAGKVSDLKRCEFLYVLATHVIWSGTYKNLHLFKIL